MHKALAWVVALVAYAAPLPALEAGREVTLLPNGHVSVSARGVPLGRLLKQFGALMALDTSLVDKKIELAPVDLAVRDVPADVALRETLQAAADVSFVLWGGDTLPDVRLAAYPSGAGDKGKPGGVPEGPAPPPPPPELDPNMDPVVAAAIQAGMSPDDPDLAMIGTGAPERTMAPEDDPDLAEILGPPPDQKKPEEAKKP